MTGPRTLLIVGLVAGLLVVAIVGGITLNANNYGAAQKLAVGEPFRLEFQSSSSLEIHSLGAASVDNPALAVRTFGTLLRTAILSVNGFANEAYVDRYETSWPVQEVFPIQGNQQIGQIIPVQPSTRFLGDATFTYALEQAAAAAIVVSESLAFAQSGSTLKVSSATQNPGLISQQGTNPMHPTERKFWSLDGPHIVSELTNITGQGDGSLHLYWTRSTMFVNTEHGMEILESRVWDEPEVNGIMIRHAVWHELRAADSEFHLSLAVSEKTRGARATLFAPRIQVAESDVLAFDSSTQIIGTLPRSNESKESSVWIRGNISTDLRAIEGGTAAPAYRGVVTGTAEAISYGGEPLAATSRMGDAAALTAGLILIGIGVAIRDLLTDMLCRAFAPLYSKLNPRELLDHSTRDRIFKAIQTSPGIHFLGLRSVAFGLGTLTHHLAQLERFGVISSRRVGRFRRFWLTGTNVGRRVEKDAFSHAAPTRIILAELAGEPGLPAKTLHQRVFATRPMTLAGVIYHLKVLERERLISVRTEGRRRRYYLVGSPLVGYGMTNPFNTPVSNATQAGQTG